MSGGFSLSNLNNQFLSLFQGDSSPLRPRAQDTPDLTIAISASLVESFYSPIWLLSTMPLNYAGGNSPSFSEPGAGKNRIDLVYINSAGTVTIVKGTEDAAPSAPNLEAAGFPICYVYNKNGQTKIVDYEDKDANPSEGYIYKDIRAMGLFVEAAFTGEIKMYGGLAAPTGWLACNGAAVSRTTYAKLFGILSTTYGVGNGSTTFNLPNFTNKMPRGNTPGIGGGADTHGHADTFAVANHKLTVAQMPSHYHTTGHPWMAGGNPDVPSVMTKYECCSGSWNTGAAGGSAAHPHGLNGAVVAGNNIPVNTAVMFIIKT